MVPCLCGLGLMCVCVCVCVCRDYDDLEDVSLLRFLVDMRGENTTSTQVPTVLPYHTITIPHHCIVCTAVPTPCKRARP